MLKFSSLAGRVMEAANHSKNSAVEAENHVKHGASSKSHTSRGYFLRKMYFALLVAFLFSATDVFAQQQKGDMSAGANVNVILPGLGAKYRYALNQNFRVEGCFNWFIKKKAENQILNANVPVEDLEDINRWDATVNAHWFFAKRKAPYLIAGVGVVHKNVISVLETEDLIVAGYRPAINIGIGWDINVGEKLTINIELKSRWLGLLSAGLVYKF